MTDRAAADGPSVDGLRTYLHCPRRYEFAHVHGLADSDDDTVDDRIAILRAAICDALRSGERDADAIARVASDRFATRWADYDEAFHSRTQRRHERRVLEATLEAYIEAVGTEHAAGIAQVATADVANGDLIGPDMTLSSRVSLPASTATDDADAVTVGATVDYVTGDGSSLIGVRFVPTLASLGPLRYRSDWEGDVAELFTDHFDPDADVFEPGPVGALLETAVVLDGLRRFRDRHGLGDRTCRYLQIPLADRSDLTVNWVRDTVETSLTIADLTEVYVDHHTFGMTHDHRNETVDSRLAAVTAALRSESFDPSDRWERIANTVCPDCAYSVCCQDSIAAEVRFDG